MPQPSAGITYSLTYIRFYFPITVFSVAMLNKHIIIALVAGYYSIFASARPAAWRGHSKHPAAPTTRSVPISTSLSSSTHIASSVWSSTLLPSSVATLVVVETPTVVVNAVGPATYTANPSIGGGGSSFKDSAHFRVYDASTDAIAGTTLQHLEAAHSCYVEQLGWRTPALSWTSDTDDAWYKTNVYSKQESDLPGAAGVQGADPVAGLAWLEVVDSYLTDPSVTVHEYGHALSVAEKNWIDQGRYVFISSNSSITSTKPAETTYADHNRTGAWWEPIANYIADTYISTPTCASAKSAQGLSASEGASIIYLDTVIGDSYKVIVDGTSGTGNYYESWPFIAYLNNNPDNYEGLGNDTLLNMFRKYTIDSNDTPLHALSNLLTGTNETVQKVVGRYWAHMAYVDIGHPKAHEAFVAQQRSLNYDNLDASGAVKSGRAPRYMGANIIPLTVTGTTVSVAITTDGEYTATLVVNSGDKISYTDVVGGKGTVSVASGDEVSLVVANTPALVQYDAFDIPAALNEGLQYSVQITGASI